MDFSGLNSVEQAHMNKVIERKQMQDFLRLYANIVERCFSSCCNDFTSKALSSKEVTTNVPIPPTITLTASKSPQDQCITSCTEKFLKHSERVGSRFAELNAEAMGAAGPGQKNP
ncbi:protein transporter tim9 [Marasmius tenuissimus]|uniref:Mitochondrial import inner membrane translocase subunit n=1 Tax=Marasmius tenuissimus TaxID=585030 RepID=A0ABR3A9S1_9AGAR